MSDRSGGILYWHDNSVLRLELHELSVLLSEVFFGLGQVNGISVAIGSIILVRRDVRIFFERFNMMNSIFRIFGSDVGPYETALKVTTYLLVVHALDLVLDVALMAVAVLVVLSGHESQDEQSKV